LNGVQEAGGSNPLTQTNEKAPVNVGNPANTGVFSCSDTVLVALQTLIYGSILFVGVRGRKRGGDSVNASR
jgi:hypothetical protein